MAAPRRKVDFLEDILKRYGVEADYWPLPGDHVAASIEGQANDDALFRDVLTSSADWVDEFLAATSDRTSKLPTYVSLGDIRTERGQRDAALKTYEAAVLEEDEAQRQCELGYLLLQRCRVEELPLCEGDFVGAPVEFGNGQRLSISSYLIDPDNPGPEFPDKPALRNLAIRAFGLAYVQSVGRCFTEERATWDDRWRELVALEGLRAAFLDADDLNALHSVRSSYYGWLEDYEDHSGVRWSHEANRIAKKRGDTVEITDGGKIQWDADDFFYPFMLNLRDLESYLQGRLRRDPANRKAAEERLAARLGDVWQHVRPVRLTRQYLINAEILLEQLDRKGDWSSAVNDLSRAVEAIIKQTLGAYADRNPTDPFVHLLRQAIGERRKSTPPSLSRLSLSTFTDALAHLVSDSTKKAMLAAWIRKWVPEADESWPDELVRQLRGLGRPRYRSDHAVQPNEPWKVSYGEAERVQNLVLGMGQTGLLPRLARLYSSLAGNNA